MAQRLDEFSTLSVLSAASLKVKAARKRLMDARGAKSALMQDMMAYGSAKNIKP
jgi:hypothetical protein